MSTTNATMNAIVLHEFGPATNLRYESWPVPEPGPGQVRVDVEAAGVHLVDSFLRTGMIGGPTPPSDLPMIPGREVAGRVDALGAGVDMVWLGERVVAHLGAASSGYAERAVAPVSAVHRIPEGLGPAEAVAMIGTGRTALLLLDQAGIGPGDVVLVPSVTGGLGVLLAQGAKNAGATVLGLANGEQKLAVAMVLGIDHAVDYTLPDWPEQARERLAGRDVTIVIDATGGRLALEAMRLLEPGGRLVFYGWSEDVPAGTEDEIAARRIVIVQVERPKDLRSLETRALADAAAGRFRPLVQRFALRDAIAAHVALEGRATTGKVVLQP